MNDVTRTPDGRKWTYLDLVTASDETLERILRAGRPPDARQLAGWEFKGYNSLDLTAFLGFRKFKKGFYSERTPTHAGERIKGYNVKVPQNGVTEPWEPLISGGHPVRHGFYDAYPVDPGEKDNLYPNALLINYDCGRNPIYDPSRFLRDYLVQVDPENPDLYLGKATIAIGPWRPAVSYFVLERHNQPEPGARLP